MNDNPREVLALLNSLGFIGITGPQLKAFLKDLKLYRKAKERERQQRKEEITKKILDKQQSMIQEILKEQHSENCSSATGTTRKSLNSPKEEPLLQLRVKYVPDQEADCNLDCENKNRSNIRKEADLIKRIPVPSKPKTLEPKREQSNLNKEAVAKAKNQKKLTSWHKCFCNEDNLLETGHSRTHSTRTQSASTTKSFIRPKKLQPTAQDGTRAKKLDPVSLYHKYQKEWKQLSLPGEAKRSALRWSVREKMLGANPWPMPVIPKQSATVGLKRKVCQST